MSKQRIEPNMAVEAVSNKAVPPENPEFSLIDEAFLKSRIYTIRGLKVMLDADLAEIYGYETKAFNRQVKNNIEKFDGDFRLQLTKEEYNEILRCKNCTLEQGKYSKFLPFAFTEQGIYMLMTVLKGERAVAQSKALIRLFKQMKDYIVAENQQLLGNVGIPEIAMQTAQNAKVLAEHSIDIKTLSGEVRNIHEHLGKVDLSLQKVMENFIDPTTYKHFLILDGQRLDADVAYTQIYGMAKKSITIIDDYVDVKTLDLLRGIARGVSVMIYSDENGYESLTEQIRKDFLKARPDVKFDKKRTNDKFHDRYIFLDYGLRGKTFPLWRIKQRCWQQNHYHHAD